MAVIKLFEDYSVSQLRKDVRDSMMMAGEQAIALSLYHPGDSDAVRCPECGDDIYDSPEAHCTSCYGTMWVGGVRYAMKVWTLFTDHQVSEALGRRGVYEPDKREIQLEAFPVLAEHDIVVRVRSWDADGSVAKVEGFYELQAVEQRSLRTGPRFGQATWDVVGQKAQLAELPTDPRGGITSYPILGQIFEQSAMLTAATATSPASITVEPDVKVIYFPFTPGPSGESPQQQEQVGVGMTFTQAIPASVWTIPHSLGYEPQVSIIVGNEEVDAEVDYPNNSVVVITFGIPVAGTARLT
jgi:hypothetical protein